MAFSPDGSTLASASNDKTVMLWDAVTGQVVRATLTGHANSVHPVVFSPDGQRIASTSIDMTIKVWDALSGRFLIFLEF